MHVFVPGSNPGRCIFWARHVLTGHVAGGGFLLSSNQVSSLCSLCALSFNCSCRCPLHFSMTVAVLEDDADPNYTHFAHREEFSSLLAKFLNTEDGKDQESDELVKAMGVIVS